MDSIFKTLTQVLMEDSLPLVYKMTNKAFDSALIISNLKGKLDNFGISVGINHYGNLDYILLRRQVSGIFCEIYM